jgi:probable biosynthetic protein (TIGR04098 family)
VLIEKLELTMSHVGLGNLNEYALLVLFGNAHSHHLVRGLSINPSQIESKNGDELYPAYFMTSLKVPLRNLLPTFKLWDAVSVGVDVKRFGETLLESKYVIGRIDQVVENIEEWQHLSLPVMEGNNLIVNEEMNGETGKRQVLNPDPDKITELVKSTRTPSGLASSRVIRNNGFDDFGLSPQFQNAQPIIYKIKPLRDALGGHAMIFAKYAEIMDVIEHDFLSEQIFPGMSDALLQQLNVVERDIYYYGNCYAGEELSINLCGEIELADDSELDDTLDFIPAGYLLINFEIYQKRTKNLLAICRVRKVFAIQMRDQEIIGDLRRLVHKY